MEMTMKHLIAAAAIVLSAMPASARSVSVKYHGPVNVDPMSCERVTRSSFINEVCYHQPTGYMLISLKGTFYHYCALDPVTHNGLMSASSMKITGRPSGGAWPSCFWYTA